ncbi:C-type mannose receptor 2 [Procambarus clarkii]|uniref:C-type mannose receptor 2 n=1 Tax=Procambarus clarkii TaxID=6728 RepID=UPI003743B429
MTAMILFTVFLLLTATIYSGLSQSTEAEVLTGASADTHIHVRSKLDCPVPYQPIADHCILVDNSLFGSWSSMRGICQVLEGDLVSLHDANVLNAIFNYLHDEGMTDVSYWVKANDQLQEGQWEWDENTPVHMNTPLWGDRIYRGVQEPTGGDVENCAILNHQDDFYMHDVNCSDAYYLLCEVTATGSERAPSSRSENLTGDGDPRVSLLECPSPYENIGGHCLFIVSPSNGTWWEQKRLCELIQGHMIKLNDTNLLGAIYDTIANKGIANYSVYIGASDIDQEGDWRFIDGESVPMGSPFWGNIGFDFQEPSGGTSENCACLYAPDHFFIHDVSCEDLIGAICEYN